MFMYTDCVNTCMRQSFRHAWIRLCLQTPHGSWKIENHHYAMYSSATFGHIVIYYCRKECIKLNICTKHMLCLYTYVPLGPCAMMFTSYVGTQDIPDPDGKTTFKLYI